MSVSKPVPVRRVRPNRGVSLIESLCAVSVLATALGVAVPSLDDWRQRQALLAAAAELETDLHYARSQAVASNRGVRVSIPDLTSGSCYVIHTGDPHDCQCSADGHASCVPGADALRVVGHADGGPVKLANAKSSIVFGPEMGTVTPTATFRLVAAKGALEVRQIVNIMGRTRTCTAGKPIAGLKAC